MFRSTRDGGVTVRLSGGEATLLRTLVVPVMELLNDPARPVSAPGDGVAGGGRRLRRPGKAVQLAR